MSEHTKIPKLLIFLPKNVTKTDFRYLYGDIEHRTSDESVVYFITDSCEHQTEKSAIGVWTKSRTTSPTKPNFVVLSHNLDTSILVKIEEECVKSKIVILYDSAEFHNRAIAENPRDLFAMLNKKLATRTEKSQQFPKVVQWLGQFLKLFVLLLPVVKYSSTAVQLKTTCERFLWALGDNNVKAKNFFLSVVLDISLGFFCLYFLLAVTSTSDFPDLFLWISEQCVNGLRNLLQWLAGSPAGFKLNKQLNGILAKFFIFYTDIWWIFLGRFFFLIVY